MLECLTEWVSPPLYVWQGTGKVPARAGVRNLAPEYFVDVAAIETTVQRALQLDK